MNIAEGFCLPNALPEAYCGFKCLLKRAQLEGDKPLQTGHSSGVLKMMQICSIEPVRRARSSSCSPLAPADAAHAYA
jgi:hypothetical protein